MQQDKRTGKPVPSLDRVPPQNIDAERMILGAMMTAESSRTTVPVALERLSDTDFYRESHRMIFRAIANLFDRASAVDLVTTTSQLEKESNLEKVGGVPYLDEMIESVPTVENIEYYIKLVKSMAIKRRVIQESARLYHDGFDNEMEGEELALEAQRRIMKIGSETVTELSPVKSVIKETFSHIQELYGSTDAITGIPTGFDDLDAMTAGLQKSEFIVVGARPSMGKSAFLQKIVEHVAVDCKFPVLLFSPEMSRRAVAMRMFGSIGNVSCHALRMGALQEHDWPKLTIAASILSEAPIYIDDTANINIEDLRSKAYQAIMQYGIKLIAVDYIQELRDKVAYRNGRQEEMASISGKLKGLARELDIPILTASQLSRGVEGRPDKRPVMSDLRESGAVEQDADVVMFLYRENYYEKDCTDSTTEVIVRKQRNGPTGTIKLYFNMRRLRFENLAQTYYKEPY